MTWNYRVCKQTYRKGEISEEVSFTIREVYYNKDGSIWAATEGAKGVAGDSVEDLRQGLEWMSLALNKDILDIDTFVFAKPDFDKE